MQHLLIVLLLPCHFIRLEATNSSADDTQLPMDVSDSRSELFYLLYGDLSDMSGIFLPDDGDESDDNSSKSKTPPPTPFTGDLQYETERLLAEDEDVRQMEDKPDFRRQYYVNRYDYNEYPELRKQDRLVKMGWQFLIHTRYKVGIALRYRKQFRKDKRYRLGFLFCKLRRLRYDLRKLGDAGVLRDVSDYRSFHVTMYVYIQMTRVVVDIKNTLNFIKRVYAEPDPLYDSATISNKG